MLFIANVLELNGGTTFILRLAREFSERKAKLGVLVMSDIIDKGLEDKIRQYADIYYLKDYSSRKLSSGFRMPLGCFLPLNKPELIKLIELYGSHAHVMGVFGLLFMKRLCAAADFRFKVSFGVYHQNEIMFDGVQYYFASKAKKLFSLLPAESVVFFNEKNIESYQAFYGKDFSGSTLVPIGIEIPKKQSGLLGDPDSDRLISIGNLHVFKAYNRHIISLLPELKKIRPNLVYEIYGTGPYKSELSKLVSSLGLESSVIFKGAIAYEEIPNVLKGGLAFVGSGTAIIESSALGLPSIIGIESVPDPVTYGFLGDIEGFSYNELAANQSTYMIIDKLISIIKSSEEWQLAAASCKSKAQEFSIEHTANGFMKLEESVMDFDSFRAEDYSNFFAGLSFVKCAIKYKLGFDKEFIGRRDQGTLA